MQETQSGATQSEVVRKARRRVAAVVVSRIEGEPQMTRAQREIRKARQVTLSCDLCGAHPGLPAFAVVHEIRDMLFIVQLAYVDAQEERSQLRVDVADRTAHAGRARLN